MYEYYFGDFNFVFVICVYKLLESNCENVCNCSFSQVWYNSLYNHGIILLEEFLMHFQVDLYPKDLYPPVKKWRIWKHWFQSLNNILWFKFSQTFHVVDVTRRGGGGVKLHTMEKFVLVNLDPHNSLYYN